MENRVGRYTPAVLLARLGICLMKRLRTPDDILLLSDEEAALAVRLIPQLQRPMLSAAVVARVL